jgi:hypothetical protein
MVNKLTKEEIAEARRRAAERNANRATPTTDPKQEGFLRDVEEYFSEWETGFDDSMSLRENVIENLKAFLEIVLERAECDISRRRDSDPMPEEGSGRGEVGDLLVTVWPLGLDGGWIHLTRKEDIYEPDEDDDD